MSRALEDAIESSIDTSHGEDSAPLPPAQIIAAAFEDTDAPDNAMDAAKKKLKLVYEHTSSKMVNYLL